MNRTDNSWSLFSPLAREAGLALSGEQLERLERTWIFFRDKVLPFGWVKVKDPVEFFIRHLLDSILPFFLVPDLAAGFDTLVDVGSGPGLPLFPVLAAFPHLQGLIIEPRASMEKPYLVFRRECPGARFEYFFGKLARFREDLPPGSRPLLVTRATLAPAEFFRQQRASNLAGAATLLYRGPDSQLDPESNEGIPAQKFEATLPDGRSRGFLFFPAR